MAGKTIMPVIRSYIRTLKCMVTVADPGIEFGGGGNFRSGREFEGGS